MSPVARRRGGSARAARVGLRLAALTALWLVLTGGAPASWAIGAPAILLATVVMWSDGSRVPSLLGTLRFVPRFLYYQVAGGLLVARQALARHPRPGVFMHYSVSLSNHSAVVLFAAIASLTPGTVATRLDTAGLRLHVLGDPADARRELRSIELHIAAIYGERPA